MNLDLRALLSAVAGASLRTKALAVMAVLALAAVISVAGLVASQPHYVTLYSGLDDAERVAVEKALAEGGVRYRVSAPPKPYAVFVDDSQFDQAQIQVALAEALRRAPTGINSGDGGAATLFMSSGERAQSMLKREWQEAENLLAQLDFVQRATVTTSIPDPSVLRRKEPLTVSVALRLRDGRDLSAEQAEAVAKLVRFRFGVPAENVLVTDQAGRTVHDPAREGDDAQERRLLEHAAVFDRDLAAKVNGALERAWGADKAYVTITSEWDTDQSTTVSESLDGEPREVSVNKTESRTPGPAPAAGGPAGSASNVAQGFGVESAAVAEESVAGGESTTRDERTVYELPRSRIQTVRVLPQLARLNVSLVVDASLAARKDEVRTLVASAVGFDAKRSDQLGVTVADMTAREPAAPQEPAPESVPSEQGLSPTLELLLRRGVEIVSALSFVLLLFFSLRGARKSAAAAAQAGSGMGAVGSEEAPVDPELLARSRVEELVKSDPRRVGEILSRWASEEAVAKT